MALGKDEIEWGRMASLIATLQNQHRDKNKPAIRPDQISPYTAKGQAGKSSVKLTANNIDILKAFVR